MDIDRAISKAVLNFTNELFTIFSALMLETVGQVSRSMIAAPGSAVALEPRRRPGRPPKAASTTTPAKPRKAKARAVAKSSPAEVNRLGERIVAVLGKSPKNLSAKEIRAALRLTADDEGRFDYALGKLKASREVTQHGERGQARYGVGRGEPKAKRGPGRPRKTPSTATPAVETPATSETPVEAAAGA